MERREEEEKNENDRIEKNGNNEKVRNEVE